MNLQEKINALKKERSNILELINDINKKNHDFYEMQMEEKEKFESHQLEEKKKFEKSLVDERNKLNELENKYYESDDEIFYVRFGDIVNEIIKTSDNNYGNIKVKTILSPSILCGNYSISEIKKMYSNDEILKLILMIVDQNEENIFITFDGIKQSFINKIQSDLVLVDFLKLRHAVDYDFDEGKGTYTYLDIDNIEKLYNLYVPVSLKSLAYGGLTTVDGVHVTNEPFDIYYSSIMNIINDEKNYGKKYIKK